MSDTVVEYESSDMKENLTNTSSIINAKDIENKFPIQLSEEIWIHLFFQYAIAAFHVTLVIPSNIFTLFVILKTKSLWNFSNVILAINAFFLATGSFFTLFLRQAHFPFVLYDKPQRIIAYAALWWVCSLTFRIGNNSYMMLAFFRYISVCLHTNSWFSKQTAVKPTVKSVSVILLVLMTPSIVWTASMFFGCPAAGKVWNFIPTSNFTNASHIVAFQHVSENGRGPGRSGITVMTIFLVLQLIVTLFLYVKICHTCFSSTRNISLKREASSRINSEKIATLNRNGGCNEVPMTQINNILRVQRCSDKTNPQRRLTKSISSSESNLQSNFMNNEKIPKRSQSCKKFLFNRTSAKNTQIGPVPSNGGSKSVVHLNRNYILKVPHSERIVSVSRKDIFCTTSLTLQIICLLITHGLTIFAFSISGQKVSLKRFILSYYAFEIAFLINTMIHPLVCILFSSNYRDAAKSILFKIRYSCVSSK